MGIRQFGHVKFDGVDLADFGVTLSGTGTYNAPERDVTSMSVPGRNGDLLFDNGRYMNTEVVYPINIELGLPDKVQALRAFLLSHKGYFRLEDSYHPEEFRMAQYAGPFEITPTGSHNRYGRMELVFDCKPQRFLKAGEQSKSYIGTASTPSYYVIGDFLQANAALITSAAKSAGYTDNDITNFKYALIDLSSFTTGDMLEFEVGSDSPFFAEYFLNNPISAISSYPFASTDKNLYFTSGSLADYAVIKRDFNVRIYKNGVLLQDDAAFDYLEITNPTLFDSHPLLKFTLTSTNMSNYIGGIGDCGIYFNCSDSNLALYANILTIDTETLDAYCSAEDSLYGIHVNYNKYISFSSGDLVIKPGENDVLLNASTGGLEIIPRWWRI